MASGTQSLQSPQGPSPLHPSRIPKVTRSASVSGHQLSPALLSAKLSTLLSSVRGREGVVSRTPSPRTPSHLLRPVSAGVRPSPATPSSGLTPSSVNKITTPGSRVDTPFVVVKTSTPNAKSTKASDRISSHHKPGPSHETRTAEKINHLKTSGKPLWNFGTRNTTNSKALTTQSNATENTNAVKKSSTLGSRKSASMSTLYKNRSFSTVKPSSTENKENAKTKQSINTMSKTKQISNTLKPLSENSKTKPLNPKVLPKRATAKASTATTSKTVKPVSTPSSQGQPIEEQPSSESGNDNNATIIPGTSEISNEEFKPETVNPEEELSVSKNTSAVSETFMAKSPTLFSPSHLKDHPESSEVWALASRLVNTSQTAESADISSVEVPLPPVSLAQYLKENEVLETKDIQKKILSFSSELDKTFHEAYSVNPLGHSSGSECEMETIASTSTNSLKATDLPLSGGRSPVLSPRSKSPICVVSPLPPTDGAVQSTKGNTHCPYCQRDLQDTITGFSKVSLPCGHSCCAGCHARARAANLPRCLLCAQRTLQSTRISL